MNGHTKTLYLLRHAKSAWDTAAPDDFSRPLNPRGTRDAVKVGQWMQQRHLRPESIVSSPALRAWQTVTTVCQTLQIEPAAVNFDKHLYLADTAQLCQVIATTDNALNSLLLVGHNPGLAELVEYLLGDDVPAGPDGKLMPTAALCILQLPGWGLLSQTPAHLTDIIYPKSLA